MEQLTITTALTTITTTSRSLFNRYYSYLWHRHFKTMISEEDGCYSITIFGLNSEEANCLTEQFVDRFNLVKCDGEVTMAA